MKKKYLIACFIGMSTTLVILFSLYTRAEEAPELIEYKPIITEETLHDGKANTANIAIIEIELPKPKFETYEITAYTLRYEECGKHPDHPLYGVTASGKKATRGVTIAASKEIPFGTKVYIPFFDGLEGWENQGIFVVQDRGGAIKNSRIDVFFGDGASEVVKEALQFGRRELEVLMLD